MNIKEIETLTLEQVKAMEHERITIKEHDCYLVDLEGYFGYSILVFKGNGHLYYANDYELHHKQMNRDELVSWYKTTMENKLFTDSELLDKVKNYDDYRHKSYYVRNYWIQQFEHDSIFCIGDLPKEREEKRKSLQYYCDTCFCYVDDIWIVEKAKQYIEHIDSEYKRIKEDDEVFREMISYELANHEACITMDPADALDALGLRWNSLTNKQKGIVKYELDR